MPLLPTFPGQQMSFVPTYQNYMDGHRSSVGLEQTWDLVIACNVLVDASKPWALAKREAAGDEIAAHNLDAVLYMLAESLRIIAILLSPVLPKAAHGIFDQLNWKMDEAGKESRFRLANAAWGGLPDGHQLGTPTPLFPRIELPKA